MFDENEDSNDSVSSGPNALPKKAKKEQLVYVPPWRKRTGMLDYIVNGISYCN